MNSKEIAAALEKIAQIEDAVVRDILMVRIRDVLVGHDSAAYLKGWMLEF